MKNLAALELKVPPVVVFLVFAGAIVLVHKLCPAAEISIPARRGLTLLLGAIGGSLGVAGVATFLWLRTTIHPECPERTTKLVTCGIYRISRNPMYTGLLFALAALALHFANILAFLFLPGFVLYMNRFQIRPEERILRNKFGPEFDAFTRATRRWL